MHPVDRGDAAVIQRAKCTNGEVFLGNVCISFNGDLKLYVNMPKRRIFSGTRAVKTSGNALSSCENTMRLNDMESTGFLFCVHPQQSPAKGSPCSKIQIKNLYIQYIMSNFSSSASPAEKNNAQDSSLAYRPSLSRPLSLSLCVCVWVTTS